MNDNRDDQVQRPSESAESFESALAAVERLAAELEDGRLPLAEALAKYETGVKHLKQCYDQLAQAERKIELLTGVDADGNPITKPFDTETANLSDRAGTRKRKRLTDSSADSATE